MGVVLSFARFKSGERSLFSESGLLGCLVEPLTRAFGGKSHQPKARPNKVLVFLSCIPATVLSNIFFKQLQLHIIEVKVGAICEGVSVLPNWIYGCSALLHTCMCQLLLTWSLLIFFPILNIMFIVMK